MPVTMHIDQLREACSDQCELFKETFGESVSFETEAEMVAAARKYARDLNFTWAAGILLSAAAYAEYRKARDAANVEYWKVRDAAWAEYRKARAAAHSEYWKVCNLAHAKFRKVLAEAFARAYWAQETA